MKYGYEYLKTKLNQKRYRVDLRYKYYDMKNCVDDLNISTPPAMRWLNESLGWCGKAVDSVADRMQFYGFKNDNFDMQSIFDMNNSDVLIDGSIQSMLISACSFIYVSVDENGYPTMQTIDGGRATGIIDTTTNMLTEGYAVLAVDANDNVLMDAYLEPYKTTVYTYNNGKSTIVQVYTHKAPYPLLVPMINRPDAKRPFGHSRISRACMDLQDAAIRTIKRSEISAEFYSYPQKYVTGLSPEAEKMDKWRATMSSMITFEKDEDGDHPIVGQFQQQSMTPHFEQLRSFACLFGGETGLTLDDLGFAGANPSSSEAIKATHENLRLYVAKSQRCAAVGLINAGYLASCLRDDFEYSRTAIYDTKVLWQPIFATDFNQLSSVGDGILKINQAIPGYFDKEAMRVITGIDYGE